MLILLNYDYTLGFKGDVIFTRWYQIGTLFRPRHKFEHRNQYGEGKNDVGTSLVLIHPLKAAMLLRFRPKHTLLQAYLPSPLLEREREREWRSSELHNECREWVMLVRKNTPSESENWNFLFSFISFKSDCLMMQSRNKHKHISAGYRIFLYAV